MCSKSMVQFLEFFFRCEVLPGKDCVSCHDQIQDFDSVQVLVAKTRVVGVLMACRVLQSPNLAGTYPDKVFQVDFSTVFTNLHLNRKVNSGLPS